MNFKLDGSTSHGAMFNNKNLPKPWKEKHGNRKQMQCKIVTSQELCKEKETSMAKKN
jgi:hypothetical protein